MLCPHFPLYNYPLQCCDTCIEHFWAFALSFPLATGCAREYRHRPRCRANPYYLNFSATRPVYLYAIPSRASLSLLASAKASQAGSVANAFPSIVPGPALCCDFHQSKGIPIHAPPFYPIDPPILHLSCFMAFDHHNIFSRSRFLVAWNNLTSANPSAQLQLATATPLPGQCPTSFWRVVCRPPQLQQHPLYVIIPLPSLYIGHHGRHAR